MSSPVGDWARLYTKCLNIVWRNQDRPADNEKTKQECADQNAIGSRLNLDSTYRYRLSDFIFVLHGPSVPF